MGDGKAIKDSAVRTRDGAAAPTHAAPGRCRLGMGSVVVIAAGAVAAFDAAYEWRETAPLMAAFLFCLCAVAHAKSVRVAFYAGLAIGFVTYASQATFLLGIFGPAALALWLILALWVALFVLLARLCIGMMPYWLAVLAMPFLWTGLEYFRCELYYLRFTWLTPGFAFFDAVPCARIGIYGISFLAMMLCAAVYLMPQKLRIIGTLAIVGLVLISPVLKLHVAGDRAPDTGPLVVGIQLEHPSDREVLQALDKALAAQPDVDLLMLSEYTFGSPVPRDVLDWCGMHKRYLIVGGIEPVGNAGAWADTAFVVGPEGRGVFQQGKSVPIQFFADGVPATEQKVWESPWGKIGLCVCYDLSYTRVTDGLVEKGAGAILVPTMDLISWGRHEHELHGRVGPVRAAEYGVPVLRVCSSGISQLALPTGRVVASAPFLGQGEMIVTRLPVQARGGRLPVDRVLGPVCVGVTGGLGAWLVVVWWRRRQRLAPRADSN